MNSVHSTWNDFLFCSFWNGHFHKVVSTLTNVVKLYVEKDNVVLTLSTVAHINVEIRSADLTLFEAENSNVETDNVVSTLIFGCTTWRRHINQNTTLKELHILHFVQTCLLLHSSNVNEVIRTVLNFLLFPTKRTKSSHPTFCQYVCVSNWLMWELAYQIKIITS